MYQHLLYANKTSILSGEQIKAGWLKHIKHEEENYLWVANQKALDMMMEGVIPPETSNPALTKDSVYGNYYEMIDAQLTTEIFGFFAPGRPDIALRMAQTFLSVPPPAKTPSGYQNSTLSCIRWLLR